MQSSANRNVLGKIQSVVGPPAIGPRFSGFREQTAKAKITLALDPGEKARIEIMDRATELKSLSFEDAAREWLEQRSLYIRASTVACYADYLHRLVAFASPPLPSLDKIHIGHFVTYQAEMKKHYHPASVNHDLNILSQMLKAAGLWEPIRDYYRPLPLPELDPPKVMSEAEEDRFFKFAFENGKEEGWELAYCVASLTNNSTASGKELRMLQLGAIHLDANPPYFCVPKNMKTASRQRTIPLNAQGIIIMERLIKTANSRGSTRPEHYLFPFREKRNKWEPTLPATESWLKAQWKKLVDAALEKKVISFRIKPHNLRHQAITNLLDNGVPIELVRQIAGHGVDSLITRHYHHGRLETLARAMERIAPQGTNGNKRSEGESA